MSGTLYTYGQLITMTVAEFESYDTIFYAPYAPLEPVHLKIADAGALDLSDELGTTSALITTSEFGNFVTIGVGPVSLHGGIGNDKFVAGDGDNWFDGGAGDDIVLAGNGNDVYYFSAGNDFVDLGGVRNVPGGGWG